MKKSTLFFVLIGFSCALQGMKLGKPLDPTNPPQFSEFFKACLQGDLETVKDWVEQKEADVNERGPILNACPLMMVSAEGNLPMIEYLVNHGADVNLTDEFGHTALHYACSDPKRITDEEIAKIMYFLVVNGADLSVKDQLGHTPYFYLGRSLYRASSMKYRNIDTDVIRNVFIAGRPMDKYMLINNPGENSTLYGLGEDPISEIKRRYVALSPEAQLMQAEKEAAAEEITAAWEILKAAQGARQ